MGILRAPAKKGVQGSPHNPLCCNAHYSLFDLSENRSVFGARILSRQDSLNHKLRRAVIESPVAARWFAHSVELLEFPLFHVLKTFAGAAFQCVFPCVAPLPYLRRYGLGSGPAQIPRRHQRYGTAISTLHWLCRYLASGTTKSTPKRPNSSSASMSCLERPRQSVQRKN